MGLVAFFARSWRAMALSRSDHPHPPSVLEEERRAPLIDYARRGAHIWSPRAELVTKTSMAEAREAGLQVHPWTVNEPLEMQRLIDLGVDGIISVRPDLLVARRK